VSSPALSFEDAAVERGGRLVWSDGTFAVPRGSVVVLIGPNGSGKTTLLQVVLGLLPLSHGRVEVLGHPTQRGSDRVGYVPQNYAASVPDAVLVWDLVALGLSGTRFGPSPLRSIERQRVDDALEAVDAADLARRRMSQLSGGQQQRVAIAQALVDEPELLLLDEPLANLDLRSQHEIVALLGALRSSRDVTIVVVAHDLNPLLPVLSGAIYLLDGHPHFDAIGDVVDEGLLSHLYGTQIRVVRTAQGDLFTRTT
jgi:zinc/manganese transport system ATP-binding protein